MDWKIILLAFLLLVGVYFLGRGITGLVVSQSCCFGPDCPAEYRCVAPQTESPAATRDFNIMLGSIMLIGAVLLSYSFYRSRPTGNRRKV